MGICHSYAPDGRCISLLKILLTNFCQYDCLYCVNRVTSNVAARALHGRRGGAAHARLLPAQLHRGAVPVERHHPEPRLHDGAGGRGGARAARGARLSRLHPPEDDSRRIARTAGSAPAAMPTGCQHQRRAAHRRGPARRWRPKRTAPPSTARWRACASTSTRRKAPRASTGRAGDRVACRGRRTTPPRQRAALCARPGRARR